MFPLDGGQAVFYGCRLLLGPGTLALEITRWSSLVTAALVGVGGYLYLDSLFIPVIAAFSAYQSWQLGRPRPS